MVEGTIQKAERVAFNTIILYVKLLVKLGISLFSTRLVLNALGATDFGIFNLIAGVIAMLSFLNGAMTASTQRYLSFYQGLNDFEIQKKIFTNSWILHIALGAFIVILLWAISSFLFDDFLNIPTDRIPAAKAIYYFMSISVFFTIVSVPFTATLNAHENMLWIANVNIIEVFLNLAIALSLTRFIQAERLTMFGVLTAVVSLIVFLFYAVFCLKKYKECNIKKYKADKHLIKELSGFAGWNLFGALCGIGRTQGLAIILNVFFGAIVNAAYGIAVQVAQIQSFSATMLQAINPQIMKSEGMGDRQRMLRLSMMASKCGFFLFAIVTIPIIFEMSAILKIWLKNVPEYTVVFCSLFLIVILINQITIGLQSAIQAVGKIKTYQTVVGGIQLLNLPIAYLMLRQGFPPYSVLQCAIIIEMFACVFRLFFLKKIAGLSIREYFNRVILKEILPLFTIVFTCWFITSQVSIDFRFFITGIISSIIFAISVYFLGLCKDEKELVNILIKKLLNKKDEYKLYRS